MSPQNLTRQLLFTLGFFVALLLLFPAKKTTAEPNNDLPDIALVYDLSNSMWAPLNEVSKVTLAQKGIATGLKNLNGKINFAMLSFGHKEKTGCDNVEIISPLNQLREEEAALAIKPLRPRGNAPIARSLQDAAKLNNAKNAPFTIILLSDGTSNCPADPCKTAASLKQSMPGLTIDIIALGNSETKTNTPLRCISKATGGRFNLAKNSADIAALIRGSIKRSIETKAQFTAGTNIAENSKDPTAENDWAGATEIVVTPTEKDTTGALDETDEQHKFNQQESEIKKSHGGLALVAHLITKGTPIKSGLVWRIYNKEPDKTTGKHKLISAHKTARPVMSLPAGDYLINAAYGRAFLTRKIKIKPGKNKTEHFILNAGGLKIASVLANGNPVPENSVVYDILADERDQFGKRLRVITNVRPGLVVRLNAGIYHIVSTYGDANAQSRADVSVEAGKLTEATIDHQAAKVTFKLVYQKGGEALADTKWSLLSPTGKVIKKTAGALPTHYLAAGDYTVLAERGVKKYTENFTVTAGDTRQIEVIIQ